MATDSCAAAAALGDTLSSMLKPVASKPTATHTPSVAPLDITFEKWKNADISSPFEMVGEVRRHTPQDDQNAVDHWMLGEAAKIVQMGVFPMLKMLRVNPLQVKKMLDYEFLKAYGPIAGVTDPDHNVQKASEMQGPVNSDAAANVAAADDNSNQTQYAKQDRSELSQAEAVAETAPQKHVIPTEQSLASPPHQEVLQAGISSAKANVASSQSTESCQAESIKDYRQQKSEARKASKTASSLPIAIVNSHNEDNSQVEKIAKQRYHPSKQREEQKATEPKSKLPVQKKGVAMKVRQQRGKPVQLEAHTMQPIAQSQALAHDAQVNSDTQMLFDASKKQGRNENTSNHEGFSPRKKRRLNTDHEVSATASQTSDILPGTTKEIKAGVRNTTGRKKPTNLGGTSLKKVQNIQPKKSGADAPKRAQKVDAPQKPIKSKLKRGKEDDGSKDVAVSGGKKRPPTDALEQVGNPGGVRTADSSTSNQGDVRGQPRKKRKLNSVAIDERKRKTEGKPSRMLIVNNVKGGIMNHLSDFQTRIRRQNEQNSCIVRFDYRVPEKGSPDYEKLKTFCGSGPKPN